MTYKIVTDRELALERENTNMMDTINNQAEKLQKLRKVLEMKDLTIDAKEEELKKHRELCLKHLVMFDEFQEEIAKLKADAERYQQLRRGQKWSVIDGIGNTLRADELDAAINAAMKESKS